MFKQLSRSFNWYKHFVALVFIFSFLNTWAQGPLGTWRDHLSYGRASHVEVAGNRIFAAVGSGMIVYNKDDSSIEKLSKVNGLSDVDISSIKWSEENSLLIIGYANGNLDIIEGNRIINMSDILRSTVQGSKNISNIMVLNNRAYLSCSFGIVVVDLHAHEIIDTYFLGEEGIRLAVNDMAFDGNYLYAATSSGLYRADLNAPNLLDFSYWDRLDFLPEPGSLFVSLEWFAGRLYAVQMNNTGKYVSFGIDGYSFEYFTEPSDNLMVIRASENYLSVISTTGAEIYDQGMAYVKSIDDYGFWGFGIRDVLVEEDGHIWIADRIHGLVRGSGNSFRVLTPPGPYSNRVFSIRSYPGRTYFAAGGYNSAFGNLWHNGEFSQLIGEEWSSRLNYDVRDVVDVIENPGNPDILYLATWGYGLLEYREGSLYKRYTEENSSLRSIIPGGDFIRIGGMAFDNNKNLWLTNSGVPEPVSVMKENGEWTSFPYGGIINHDYIGDIMVNRHGHKWVLLPRGGGLFAFANNQSAGSDDQLARKFSITDEDNSLISNEVFSFAEDDNGFIWVGTNNGVVVYYNPGRVFSNDNFFARRIVVSGSREEELGYLLNNETVTAIAIDGADRKWFGTMKSGAFLVSADGRNQIHHFTRQNSPLPDNNITDIAIDPATGEVFFGTSAGVVSYRGDATAPGDAFKNVYVFPNPVRESYHGPVTVTGLVKNAVVKITDISGNLVYETVSLGGQAIWDGRNSRGRRVQTGIYLVFLSNPDGTETHVTKLMFIH